MTTTPALQDQISHEVETTLKLLDDARQKARRDEVPPLLWLRAARGCWLLKNLDWAIDFYRRAALGLVAHATGQASRSGNFEQFAQLSLAAAWMTENKSLLSDVVLQVEAATKQQLTSVEYPPEVLVRCSLVLTQLRQAWYRRPAGPVAILASTPGAFGQPAFGQPATPPPLKQYDVELDRNVNRMDAWGKAFWQGERGSATHAFIKAVLSGKVDPQKAALIELDKRLVERRSRPPTVADLVDEEFISFATALTEIGVPLPATKTPVTPGTFS